MLTITALLLIGALLFTVLVIPLLFLLWEQAIYYCSYGEGAPRGATSTPGYQSVGTNEGSDDGSGKADRASQGQGSASKAATSSAGSSSGAKTKPDTSPAEPKTEAKSNSAADDKNSTARTSSKASSHESSKTADHFSPLANSNASSRDSSTKTADHSTSSKVEASSRDSSKTAEHSNPSGISKTSSRDSSTAGDQSKASTNSGKPADSAKKDPKPAKKPIPKGSRIDPTLGLIYTDRPEEDDDLKAIKGVANVLEARLHDYGIYTYRQIVEWKPGQVKLFSEKLAFADRIERDEWQAQCRELHREKYGESLS